MEYPRDVRRDGKRQNGPQNHLKPNEGHAEVVNGARKMRFVFCVQIAVGQAVDHVSEREKKEEEQDTFPKRLGFERG